MTIYELKVIFYRFYKENIENKINDFISDDIKFQNILFFDINTKSFFIYKSSLYDPIYDTYIERDGFVFPFLEKGFPPNINGYITLYGFPKIENNGNYFDGWSDNVSNTRQEIEVNILNNFKKGIQYFFENIKINW